MHTPALQFENDNETWNVVKNKIESKNAFIAKVSFFIKSNLNSISSFFSAVVQFYDSIFLAHFYSFCFFFFLYVYTTVSFHWHKRKEKNIHYMLAACFVHSFSSEEMSAFVQSFPFFLRRKKIRGKKQAKKQFPAFSKSWRPEWEKCILSYFLHRTSETIRSALFSLK